MLYQLLRIHFIAFCLAFGPAAFADDATSSSNPHAASPEATATPAAGAAEGKSQSDAGTGDPAEEQVGQLRKDLDKARDALIDFGKKFADAAMKDGGIDQAGLEELRKQFETLKQTIKGLQDRGDNLDQADSNLLSRKDRDHLERLKKIIAKLDEKLKGMDGSDPDKTTDVKDIFAQFDTPEAKKAMMRKAQMRPESPEDKPKTPSNEGEDAGEDKPPSKSLWDGIADSSIGRKVKDIGNAISDAWTSTVSALGDAWKSAKDTVTEAANNFFSPSPDTAEALAGRTHAPDNGGNAGGEFTEVGRALQDEPAPLAHAYSEPETTALGPAPAKVSNSELPRGSGNPSPSEGEGGEMATPLPMKPSTASQALAENDTPEPNHGNGRGGTSSNNAPLVSPMAVNPIAEDDLPSVPVDPPIRTAASSPAVADGAPVVHSLAPVAGTPVTEPRIARATAPAQVTIEAPAPISPPNGIAIGGEIAPSLAPPSAVDLSNSSDFWRAPSANSAPSGALPAPLMAAAVTSAAAAARAALTTNGAESITRMPAATEAAFTRDAGSLRAGSLYPIPFGVPGPSGYSMVTFSQPSYVSGDSSYVSPPSYGGGASALATGSGSPAATITSDPIPQVSRAPASVDTDGGSGSGWKALLSPVFGESNWLVSLTSTDATPDPGERPVGVTGLQVKSAGNAPTAPALVEPSRLNLEKAVASQGGDAYNPPLEISALLAMVRAPALPPMVVSPSKPNDQSRALMKKDGVGGMLDELDGDEDGDPTATPQNSARKKLKPRTLIKEGKGRPLPGKHGDVPQAT